MHPSCLSPMSTMARGAEVDSSSLVCCLPLEGGGRLEL